MLHSSVILLIFLSVLSFSQSQDSEKTFRVLVARQNHILIQKHNSQSQKKFQLKPYPKFIGQTKDQLFAKYLGNRKFSSSSYPKKDGQVLLQAPRPNSNSILNVFLPMRQVRINWTQKGMVSSVKQQGQCGSCYAFAGLGDIQSSYLFKKIKLDLSQQQIIDCSQSFGNEGCSGGWMPIVFVYAMLKGVTTEARYPLRSQTFIDGIEGKCERSTGQFKIKNYAYTSFKIYDCQSLAKMLIRRPVTVAIAIDFQFFFYWSGVLDQCGEQINHGVQATGFIETYDENYYIIKNSWGIEWGMQGYAHLSRSSQHGNICQICFAPSFSII